MSRADWPELYERIQPHLDLKGSGNPDSEGWVTARCTNAAEHRNGDQHHSLRINVKYGGVKCMSQDCAVGPNMNKLAALLGVDAQDEPAPAPKSNGRVGTIADLASARLLTVEALSATWGVTADKKGWQIPIDDPDARSFRRFKRYSWSTSGPKYWWAPKGCPAGDLVYGLSKVPADTKELMAAAGEPDVWPLHAAALPAVSFLAGENATPSEKAIEKLRTALPQLTSIQVVYDRDEAGMKGALRVGSALVKAGLTVEILTLPDDLAEGGDITDLWLSCNADVEAFLRRLLGCESKRLEPQHAHVDQLDDDHFRVSLPANGGWTRWDFDRISRGRGRLEAELSVAVELPGHDGEPYTASVNLLSVSGRDALRRQLEAVLGDDLAWPTLINSAYTKLHTAYFGNDPSRDLATVEPPKLDARYRIEVRLPDGQAEVDFGDGSTGKTYVSLAEALCVATGEPLLGLSVIPGRVLFIDYETTEAMLRFRCDRLLAGFGLSWQPGLIDYWPAKGRPFPDIVEAVRQKVRRDYIGLVIIDSAAAACGGEPEKADVALSYFNALATLGVTTRTIAHCTKDSDNMKPFGSAFWHNEPRATWNFQRVQDEGEDAIHVGIFHRKVNDGRVAKPIGLRIAFSGETGPVTFKCEDIASVPELDSKRPLKQRILDRLQQQAQQSINDLAGSLDAEPGSVRRIINRDLKNRLHRDGDGKEALWSLLSEREAS
ncbi:MAG: AAA family ATPase [Chloroflexi bacterium]|nr:AAA family ATPase [Chloroflexota bacterium]